MRAAGFRGMMRQGATTTFSLGRGETQAVTATAPGYQPGSMAVTLAGTEEVVSLKLRRKPGSGTKTEGTTGGQAEIVWVLDKEEDDPDNLAAKILYHDNHGAVLHRENHIVPIALAACRT